MYELTLHQRAKMDHLNLTSIGHDILQTGNRALATLFEADVISINAPIEYGLDKHIRHEIEAISEFKSIQKGDEPSVEDYSKLIILLTTNGGSVDVVERITRVFREHYETVEYIIPSHAYSAGTVLALSGNKIWMDYFSVLGPIDPQFSFGKNQWVPGMGYLSKYQELLTQINGAQDPNKTRAQIAVLLEKFDPNALFQIEQAIEHSKSLLVDWLPKFKFKDWDLTETSKIKVTDSMKKDRTTAIADILGNAEHWYSHGRGISMSDLQSDRIKLKIDDFRSNKEHNSNIRHYNGLFEDYMRVMGYEAATNTIVRTSIFS